ncbi:MAG: transcription antitermination factor NusG [Maricaulis maris]|jgi:transcription antitermination factor NusG|tara:strand:- start:593 stop:1312 length:720 start_codon:yes stop_codon:yes gene_type:complete
MINHRRGQKRVYKPLGHLLKEAATRPPTETAKPRRTPRKVKRREVENRGLSANDLDTLGDLDWYLIRVPSGKEFVAERILDDAGLIVFVPTETKFRKVNRMAKTKTEMRFALIPGYCLIGIYRGDAKTVDAQWANLFRFRLVREVIGHDGRPMVLPYRQVRALLVRHSRGEFNAPDSQRWMRTYREFEAGDRVEILEGPFEGHVAEVTEIRGQQARMVLRLFGAERAVDIPVIALGRAA